MGGGAAGAGAAAGPRAAAAAAARRNRTGVSEIRTLRGAREVEMRKISMPERSQPPRGRLAIFKKGITSGHEKLIC